MAGGIDWFRWHHGSITDPKFALVARRAGASLPDVIAVWAYLLERASAAEQRGHFGDVDAEAVDCLFDFPSTETRTADIISAMALRGIVEAGHIVAWDKRQPRRERDGDSSAERTRDYRRRQRDAATRQVTPRDADVTPGDASVTPGDATKDGCDAMKVGCDASVTPGDAMRRQVTPRGEESREEHSVPNGTDGEPSGLDSASNVVPFTLRHDQPLPEEETVDARTYIFAAGVPLLTAADVTERNARSMLAMLAKLNGDAAVVAALRLCADERPIEPVSWLQSRLKGRPKVGRRAPTSHDLQGIDYSEGIGDDGSMAAAV